MVGAKQEFCAAHTIHIQWAQQNARAGRPAQRRAAPAPHTEYIFSGRSKTHAVIATRRALIKNPCAEGQ